MCDEIPLVYYGSTTQKLSYRLSGHRRVFKFFLGGKGNYVTSFEIVKYVSCKIILVEKFSCDSKEELFARERFYIENNDCVNRNIPGRTKEEYRQTRENKEKMGEYCKEYYENNKKKISEYKKEWYGANREKIAENLKEKYTCDCGSELTKGNKLRHQKTKKHQNFINPPEYSK